MNDNLTPFRRMTLSTHAVFCLLVCVCLGCTSTAEDASLPKPPQEKAEHQLLETQLLPTKEEWLAQHVNSQDKEIDLTEAVTILGLAKSPEVRRYWSIQGVLEPQIELVRKRLPELASPDQKVEALNRILLPTLRAEKDGKLGWLFKGFGSEEGNCLVLSILYTIAADAIGLHVDAVPMPEHVFLRYNSVAGIRNIETTKGGEHLSSRTYQLSLLTDALSMDVLPESDELLEKSLSAISRKELVALILCQNSARSVDDAEDCKWASRLAPAFHIPMTKLGLYFTLKLNFQEAEAALTKAHLLAPNSPTILGARANCRMLQKNHEAALKDLKLAIQLCPTWAYFHFSRSMALIGVDRPLEALIDITKAIELSPQVADFWQIRGDYYALMKQFNKAISDYTKAIELTPDNPEYFEKRAKLWAMVGNEDQYEADRKRSKDLQK